MSRSRDPRGSRLSQAGRSRGPRSSRAVLSAALRAAPRGNLGLALFGGASPRIWVVGDVMLDRYHFGSVDRLSPEAPVPVLQLSHTQDRLGGAANVAHNLATLGAQVALGGVVGSDAEGARVLLLCAEAGILTSGLLEGAALETTLKLRAVAGAHQLLRIDRERPGALSAAAARAVITGLRESLPRPDLVLVSDYAKGVVGGALWPRLVQAAGGAPIFVDPKGRDFQRYRGAALITPNEREAAHAAGLPISDIDSLGVVASRLALDTNGAAVLITRGARGLALRLPGGELLQAPAEARRVFDVTGAGDTAIAALALARARGIPWASALRVANIAAGLAVGKVGSAPVLRAELWAALSAPSAMGTSSAGNDLSPTEKRIPLEQLAALRQSTRLRGQRLVLTNGCFDLLHAGHLKLLAAARARGDVLVVALNSDASVRRLKGLARPLVAEADRAALLAGLTVVDYVVIFEEDTPLRVVQACEPDVLVKGGDYRAEDIVGGAEVLASGGQVEIIPLLLGRSTSSLVAQAQGA